MTKYQAVGETIEGEKIYLDARKLMQKGLKKHPVYQKNMFLYVGELNCNAEVRAKGNVPSDPDIQKKTSHYHRNVGDALNAFAVSIFIDAKRPLRSVVKEGVSGRHGSNILDIPCNSNVSIKLPLSNAVSRVGLENIFITSDESTKSDN